MRHPAESDLALFAGGDLGPVARWRVRVHAARCARCSRELDAFRGSTALLRREASGEPPGLNWRRLAAEMRANIRLGVDAGEVVARASSRREAFGWRAAVALAALTLVIVSGWWLYLPRLQPAPSEPGVTVGVKGDGVELRDGAGTLLLMHPKSAEPGDVMVSVDAEGGVRARYVDEQSGQVTINDVYAE